MLEYLSHRALKKKNEQDPQEYTITLRGFDLDEVALVRLRGKKLNLEPVQEELEYTYNGVEKIVLTDDTIQKIALAVISGLQENKAA